MKKLIGLILLNLVLTGMVFPCGAPGTVSGQITAANPAAVNNAAIVVELKTSSSTSYTILNPLGYYSFPVDPCVTYTITPFPTRDKGTFSPTTIVFTADDGDYPNKDFFFIPQ